MKILKIFLLLAVIVIACSLGVSAQDDAYRASVEKLLLLTKQDQLVDEMFQQIQQVQLNQLQQMNLPQEQYPVVEKYFGQIYALMKAEMGWEQMKDDFIQIYMAVYTEAEIQGLIAFYESPVGRKTIEKMPLLSQQSLEIGQKYFTVLMPKIQELARTMAAEMGAPTDADADAETETEAEAAE